MKLERLTWGGRILEQIENVYRVPGLTPQNVTTRLPIEAELIHENGEKVCVTRRVPLPLHIAMWRESKDSPWQNADGTQIWNCAQKREWRFWGDWGRSPFLCEGAKRFKPLPIRSHSLRPPEALGAPISIREAPFQEVNTRLKLFSSVRDGGIILAAKRAASRQVDIFFPHEVEPRDDHLIVFWGKGGSVAATAGNTVVTQGQRWMVPLDFKPDNTPVLAVGLAYQDTWIGAWFANDWSDLKPQFWNADRITRFASLARWMRLPWRENPSVLFKMAEEWPLETLAAWLKTEEWQLTAEKSVKSPATQDLTSKVFRGKFPGDPEVAKGLVQKWGDSRALLRTLSEADPFLMATFAVCWRSHPAYESGALNRLFEGVAKEIYALPENQHILKDSHPLVRLALRHFCRDVLSHEEAQNLEVALATIEMRCRVGAALLRHIIENNIRL